MNQVERYTDPRVCDIMTQKIIGLTASHTVFDAVQTFNKHHISSAPVFASTNGDKVLGFVSEADCLKALANSVFYDNGQLTTINVIMSRVVQAARADWDIFEVEEFFRSHGLKHAPVVDSQGHLVGMVSRRDILNKLETLAKNMAQYKSSHKNPVELSITKSLQLKVSTR